MHNTYNAEKSVTAICVVRRYQIARAAGAVDSEGVGVMTEVGQERKIGR